MPDRQLNEIRKTTSEQNKNMYRDRNYMRKREVILELENTIGELKNSLQQINSRFHKAKKQSVNSNTGHLKLSSQNNKKKKKNKEK